MGIKILLSEEERENLMRPRLLYKLPLCLRYRPELLMMVKYEQRIILHRVDLKELELQNFSCIQYCNREEEKQMSASSTLFLRSD